ncbi:MAG TPA: response regulator, partial [Planctomycetaceae bacterium]|nr:response regulator [Planctomycetaceae bacterium]
FKFTERGKVTLEVEAVTEGWSSENETLSRAGSVIALSVRDTGIGIPTDKQQIIFEAFQQADGSTSRKYGGTGLGLAISREIARLLGGEIRLVSAPGEGSTFTLYLPVTYVPRQRRSGDGSAPESDWGFEGKYSRETPAAGDVPPALSDAGAEFAGQAAPTNGHTTVQPLPAGDETPLFASDFRNRLAATEQSLFGPPEPDPALIGKKVLVVDDDIRNVFAMTSVLEETGMRVVSAETGQAALDLLEETPDVDMVLMDIMMPGMDGYDAIRAIRGSELFGSLPIIAVTAKAMLGDREKCLEAGASDYLSKPVEPAHLLSLLSKWISG